MRWRGEGGVRWLEAELPGASVRFSTRLGGVSRGSFDSLNLGILTGDERRLVLQNRRLLADSMEIDGGRVAMARQVHGSEIVHHDDDRAAGQFLQPESDPIEADGHVTRDPERPLLVLVADCLPVAVSGPGGLAMLHCGWRGLAGNLVADAVERVDGRAAAIGPGIGPCCFEVGSEVLSAFESLGAGIAAGRNCDLFEVARRSLERAGVGSIEAAGLCTSCEVDTFFSHRRDRGGTGRQAGIAWLN